MALYFSSLPGQSLRTGAAVLFLGGNVAAFVLLRSKWHALAFYGSAFVLVLLYWISIRPSNDRDWLPEAAVLASATIDGNQVTLHNVRNFDNRSSSDFTVRYDERTYDLDTLETVDFLISYFGLRQIAHTFVSFGFSDGRHLGVSIEIRKEKGESFEPLKGLFKQYELIYVVGDERDLIGSRTNFRNEDVYVYQTFTSAENVRILFLDYIRRINRLVEHPEFYNTLTSNCTTNIIDHSNTHPPYHNFSTDLLLNGYSDSYAYRRGGLGKSIPFEVLRERSLVNDRARAAYEDPRFSAKIRSHFLAKKWKTSQ